MDQTRRMGPAMCAAGMSISKNGQTMGRPADNRSSKAASRGRWQTAAIKVKISGILSTSVSCVPTSRGGASSWPGRQPPRHTRGRASRPGSAPTNKLGYNCWGCLQRGASMCPRRWLLPMLPGPWRAMTAPFAAWAKLPHGWLAGATMPVKVCQGTGPACWAARIVCGLIACGRHSAAVHVDGAALRVQRGVGVCVAHPVLQPDRRGQPVAALAGRRRGG